MASDPITGLPSAAALTGSDPIVTVQAGVTVQSDVDAMKAFMDASPIMQFKGQADALAVDEAAATGTSTFQNGDVYRINVAATAPHAFSDISEDLNIGDWVVFNGTIFQKQDGTDPTAAETKTAYESNADTNAFTDAEKTKLTGIETAATADQTGAEIKAAYEVETNAFTDTLFTKLGGIEALADVTDTANVDTAGAVMETDYNAQTVLLAVADDTPLPVTVAASSFVGRKATGDVGTMTDAEARIVLNVEDGATADQTDAEIKTAYENNANTNEFSDAEQTKLTGIEALADVTDTTNVDAAGAVMETDYNAFTVLAADTDDTPAALTVGASTLVGRKSTGGIVALTGTEASEILGVDELALAQNVLLNDQSSGILDGGIISINGGDNTKFDFTAADLHIIDNFTDPKNPVVSHIEITAQTAITATEIGTDNITFIGIRLDNVAPTEGTATSVSATINGSAGTVFITQKPTEYTREETRDIVQIGIILHSGAFITGAFNVQQIVPNVALQLYDLAFAVGVINVEGNEFSANGANLSVDKTVGKIFRQGSNNDGTAAGLKNPNINTIPAGTPMTFNYIHRNGSGGFTVLADTTFIDPDQFDDGSGTLAAVGNNKFTIKRIYVATANQIRIEYGQVIYNSISEAEEAIITATVSSATLIAESAFRGWLLVKKGETNLTAAIVAGDAKFIVAGKFNNLSPGTMLGEINTASNVGIGGVGVFDAKIGVDLQFKNINAGSSKVTITDDVANNEVDIDVVPGNINTSALNNDALFISNVVEDTTPQLGGNLDGQGNDITSLANLITDNLAINITPLGRFNLGFDSNSNRRATFQGSFNGINGVTLELIKSRGTLVAPTAVVNGDNTALLTFKGHDGTNFLQTAVIRVEVDGAVSTGVVPQAICFGTGTTAPETDHMRIGSDGLIRFHAYNAGVLTTDANGNITETAAVTVAQGGTGSITPSGARTNLSVKKVGKETLWIPATAMTPATTNGAATGQIETSTNKINVETLDFDKDTDEFAHFNIALPKSWNLGTITYQLFWTAATGGTTGIAFALQGVAIGDNVTNDTAYGTAVIIIDDAQTGANEIYVSAESAAITIANSPVDDQVCFFRLFRDVSDANDDLAEDAQLIGIKFHFTLDAEDDA